MKIRIMGRRVAMIVRGGVGGMETVGVRMVVIVMITNGRGWIGIRSKRTGTRGRR